jgi:hypothetical protein
VKVLDACIVVIGTVIALGFLALGHMCFTTPTGRPPRLSGC